ncbi:TraB/GumN family protein [Vibrio tapetis subsp. quintayensis]|uniref:TraB/GumN family protein n=1 Tax=Vibrio tapetis TaxID=52443 RepID=UPI0025B42F4B|nr:TraB/GumN family protein [Vibrio tapetis]MDN3682606.1 TraB/GumN family protein [Vibrio tapetis subsp. quintayensis]
MLNLKKLSIIGALLLSLMTLSTHAEPIYWVAQKQQVQLLLFGSIHVGDSSMYPLPSPVMNFLENSDGFVSEIDLTNQSTPVLPHSKLSTQQALNSLQANKLITLLKQHKLPTEAMLSSPPWLTAMSLQMKQINSLGYHGEFGVDKVLTDQAVKLNIPMYPLETIDFQLNMLNSLPENGAPLLTELIEQWDKADDIFVCQIDSWKNGDKDSLLTLLDSEEYDETMINMLLGDRNRAWAKQLDSGLLPKSGQFFVVVGALHLIGEDNLITLMKQQGWQVEQLSHSKTTSCI